ncbi:RacP protein [Streptomyces sp. NPDC050549]|uniref:RacP protein n=1 Tax=Streptomyces sp. NPDC050549 TaxID=3155406 RepID=UPI00343CB56E
MGRGVPAHVHAEAVLSALLEARPAGLSVVQLVAATERTRAQVHTGLAHLRQVAAAKGLPPVTWDKSWGYRMLDDAPEVWIGYERAFFESVHHRVENFIAGILLPHQKKKPDDPYIRTVMAQMGAIESTLQLLANLE